MTAYFLGFCPGHQAQSRTLGPDRDISQISVNVPGNSGLLATMFSLFILPCLPHHMNEDTHILIHKRALIKDTAPSIILALLYYRYLYSTEKLHRCSQKLAKMSAVTGGTCSICLRETVSSSVQCRPCLPHPECRASEDL